MKKNLTWILLAAMSLTLSFTATSCSDDNNDGPIDPDQIVGKWFLTNANGFYYEDGQRVPFNESFTLENPFRFTTFLEDGTGFYVDMEDGEEDIFSFEWELDGNQLTITEEYADEPTVGTIQKLTTTTLKVQNRGTDEDGAFENNFTYARVPETPAE